MGTVIGKADDKGHSYQVRVDGTPRPSLRNQVSLRPLTPGKPAVKDSPGKENIPPRKPEKKTPEGMGDECSKEPPKDTQPKRQTCKPGVLRSSQEGLMILNFLLDSTNEPSTGEGEVALARIKAIIRHLSTKQCMHALLRKDTITHRAFSSR